MRISKKCWPELFEKVLKGEKNFDLRLADFDCRPGDILVLREWDPKAKSYTGRVIEKEVTFVLKTKDLNVWPNEEIRKKGFIVMSLK
jgi:ribosomal protein S17